MSSPASYLLAGFRIDRMGVVLLDSALRVVFVGCRSDDVEEVPLFPAVKRFAARDGKRSVVL